MGGVLQVGRAGDEGAHAHGPKLPLGATVEWGDEEMDSDIGGGGVGGDCGDGGDGAVACGAKDEGVDGG